MFCFLLTIYTVFLTDYIELKKYIMESAGPPIIKNGWLVKQGGFIKTWRKRWFILTGQTLSYFKEPGQKEKGNIPINKADLISKAPECSKQPAFKINVPGTRTYYIYGENFQEIDEWIQVLENARKGIKLPDPTHISEADFQVVRLIGKGTYGKVQLVQHKKDGKVYAMKIMSKRLLEEYDQIDQILTERNVLLKTHHPFLVSAYFSFQNENQIFLILDYIPGGELFGRLKEDGKFSENRTKLYAAEILLGLGHLHSLGFIYRDLKPENILVDAEGHLKITDFGLVKAKMGPSGTTSTFCGTPEYIAPEILQQLPYTKSVDWWSYGILLFEMLTGLPPFYDENMTKMYRSIMGDPLHFPHYISPIARDLITKLLDRNPNNRLGSNEKDFEEIKSHPFFSSINWDEIINKKFIPEWIPDLDNELDTKNFDQNLIDENQSYENGPVLSRETQKEFIGFTCIQESKLGLKN